MVYYILFDNVVRTSSLFSASLHSANKSTTSLKQLKKVLEPVQEQQQQQQQQQQQLEDLAEQRAAVGTHVRVCMHGYVIESKTAVVKARCFSPRIKIE